MEIRDVSSISCVGNRKRFLLDRGGLLLYKIWYPRKLIASRGWLIGLIVFSCFSDR
jgi:hypothetical protein